MSEKVDMTALRAKLSRCAEGFEGCLSAGELDALNDALDRLVLVRDGTVVLAKEICSASQERDEARASLERVTAHAAAMTAAIDLAVGYLCDHGADESSLGADVVRCLSASTDAGAGLAYSAQHESMKVRISRLEADLRARNLEVAEVRVEAERMKEECARIADNNVDFVGPGQRSVVAEAIARGIRALPGFGGGYICDVERKYRALLWQTHGHPFAALYGDDGEMQCGADGCHLDFRRDPLEKLEEGIRKIVGEKLKTLTAPTKMKEQS